MPCLDQTACGRQLKRPVETEKLDVLAHVATVTGKSQVDTPAGEQIFKSKTKESCMWFSFLRVIAFCRVGGKGDFVIIFFFFKSRLFLKYLLQ